MKKSKKPSQLTLTAVRAAAKDIPFNPRTNKWWGIITDVGSREYYEHRAMEAIHAAREGDYDAHMLTAIRLLLLARIHGAS